MRVLLSFSIVVLAGCSAMPANRMTKSAPAKLAEQCHQKNTGDEAFIEDQVLRAEQADDATDFGAGVAGIFASSINKRRTKTRCEQSQSFWRLKINGKD